MNQVTTEVRRVLAVLQSSENRASLRRILSGAEYAVLYASTLRQVDALLRSSPPIGVVICERDLRDNRCWKNVLYAAQQSPSPPQLIVADRLADETLWGEVLNLGCYDLLLTPFEAPEVRRVVSMAWGSWRRNSERATAQGNTPEPAEPASLSSRKVSTAGSR